MRISDSANCRRDPERRGIVAGMQQDFTLAIEIASGATGCALDLGHLAAERLALGNEFEHLSVDRGDPPPEFL